MVSSMTAAASEVRTKGEYYYTIIRITETFKNSYCHKFSSARNKQRRMNLRNRTPTIHNCLTGPLYNLATQDNLERGWQSHTMTDRMNSQQPKADGDAQDHK